MKKKRIICACAAVTAAVAYLTFENTAIGVTRYRFDSEKAPESGLRICLLSDIHVKEHGGNHGRLIRLTAAQEPDVIAISGDLVDSRDTDTDAAIALAETLCSIAPVYYVTGNHEERLPVDMYLRLLDSLSAAGVHVLDGESALIAKNVFISGIHDSPSFDAKSAAALVRPGAYNIIINHRPQFAPDFSSAGFDLALCGHAHGGQVRIPFIGGLIAPDQMLFPKLSEGVHRYGAGATVISRGIGNSLIPFRINNRPEIVVIDING